MPSFSSNNEGGPHRQGRHPDLVELAGLAHRIATDPSQTIPAILAHVVHAIGGSFSTYSRLDIQAGTIHTLYGFRLPKAFSRTGPLDGRICYEALVKIPRPVAAFPNLSATSYRDSDPDIKRYQLNAFIGVPVCVEGRVVGCLAVYDDHPRPFNADHCAVMQIVAQWLAGALAGGDPDGRVTPSDHWVRTEVSRVSRSESFRAVDVLEKTLSTDRRRQLEISMTAHPQALSHLTERLQVEMARNREITNEIRLKTGQVEELNTAMRVLLDNRRADRLHIEETIRAHLVQLIDPYLDRLSRSGLNAVQQQCLDIIRMNINEVAGVPMPELSAKYCILSPAELQVANMIRNGKTTKEMAFLLSLAPRTVESYRNSIRKKLGLRNKKVNLKTFLSMKI